MGDEWVSSPCDRLMHCITPVNICIIKCCVVWTSCVGRYDMGFVSKSSENQSQCYKEKIACSQASNTSGAYLHLSGWVSWSPGRGSTRCPSERRAGWRLAPAECSAPRTETGPWTTPPANSVRPGIECVCWICTLRLTVQKVGILKKSWIKVKFYLIVIRLYMTISQDMWHILWSYKWNQLIFLALMAFRFDHMASDKMQRAKLWKRKLKKGRLY